MTLKPKDPLLIAARIILIVMMGALAVAAVACAIGIAAFFVFHGHVVAELAKESIPGEVAWAIPPLLALITGAAVMGVFFFRNLYRIVGTVGEGDPFIPENAQRLSAMGWIVVGFHVLAIPLVGIAAWVADAAKESDSIHFDGGFDLGGILLALILFILARVFREGARMREELEGTV